MLIYKVTNVDDKNSIHHRRSPIEAITDQNFYNINNMIRRINFVNVIILPDSPMFEILTPDSYCYRSYCYYIFYCEIINTSTIIDKVDSDRIQSFHMQALRRILGIRWYDKVPNAVVNERTKLPDMPSLIAD